MPPSSPSHDHTPGAALGGLRLAPPDCLFLALISSMLLHALLPVTRVIPRSCFWGCAALALVGVGLAQAAYLHMRRCGAPLEFGMVPPTLVTTGWYRRSRNPVYLGMLLLVAGEASMLGTLGALLPLPVFFLALHLYYIPAEERLLAQTFGAAWSTYAGRVRRWL